MVDALELLQQAEMGIWHRPAAELVTLAVREITRLKADNKAYAKSLRTMDAERREQTNTIDTLREKLQQVRETEEKR
jgi:hypothetical protein